MSDKPIHLESLNNNCNQFFKKAMNLLLLSSNYVKNGADCLSCR